MTGIRDGLPSEVEAEFQTSSRFAESTTSVATRAFGNRYSSLKRDDSENDGLHHGMLTVKVLLSLAQAASFKSDRKDEAIDYPVSNGPFGVAEVLVCTVGQSHIGNQIAVTFSGGRSLGVWSHTVVVLV
jgi:hypothetical protein